MLLCYSGVLPRAGKYDQNGKPSNPKSQPFSVVALRAALIIHVHFTLPINVVIRIASVQESRIFFGGSTFVHFISARDFPLFYAYYNFNEPDIELL